MGQNVIEISHLMKKFAAQTVLNDINLQIANAKIIGLIGPSGAGKSTIIKIILGMELPDSGSTKLLGKQMPNRSLLNKIGYMAQSDALYEQLTGLENLKFFAGMKKLHHATSLIDHIAEVVDLSDALDKRVINYSGGMKRRLSLAIALLGDNQILILDEPTVGVDPALRKKIWSELQRLRDQGMTILVTTHVMSEAELTDEVALLMDGKIIEFDQPEKLKEKYQVKTVEEVFLKAEETL
ncbi:ABC transporter ATP-binding protein [Companilactobacillus suantsaicola]|uniref:ABC transporter ATP-binding protein n=1 Tax=Companilactobacillus suantsaicola TaxID=2487723 RepID=A0A4Z0JRS8_9LACO|nr:ABC transporter ATP-binding protein [Companilactobacillus suantsaicola]TGD24668.1 ABC transporter ATP-binding protein [Companilactobacillus suantsaicola]